MTSERFSRWLRGFNTQSNELQFESRLPDSWTLSRLQQLLRVAENDMMFDSYALGPDQIKVLEEDLGVDPLSLALDFFLETDAELS